MSEMDKDALPIVAYSPGYHLVSCAIYDPSPGHCDCGSTEEPLVKLADAKALLRRLVAQREADREAMRQGLTDEEIDALLPEADGTAEADKTPVVVNGIKGYDFTEVDAWSKPLVRQAVRAAIARLTQRVEG